MQASLLPCCAVLAALSASALAQVAWTPVRQMAASNFRDLLRFDPARQRLAVFDARDLSDAWEWTGSQWTHRTSAHAPPPSGYQGSRILLTADPIRNRLVAVVPLAAFPFRSLWEWDGTDWTQPAATLPAGTVHLLVFDPASRRVLAAIDGTSWTWDGTTWRGHGMAPTGLTEVFEAAADPTRNRVVALGSDMYSAFPSSTWEWDGQAWTRVPGATLPPPMGGVLVFEPLRSRIVVTNSGYSWEWNGQHWSPGFLLPTPLPWGAFATDPARSQVVYFGGQDQSGSLHADLYAWNGTSWVVLAVGGWTPSLTRTGAAVSPTRGVIVTGGQSLDTWECAPRTGQWVRSQAMPQGQRLLPSVAYHAGRGNVVRFGGQGNALQGLLDEFSEWTIGGWLPVPATRLPTRRAAAAMVYDTARAQLVLFGGSGVDAVGQPTELGDTWVFDGTTWRDVTPAGGPGPRVPFGMAYDEARACVVLVGGQRSQPQPSGEILDTWEWNGSAWLQRVAGTWSNRPSYHRCLIQYDAARQRTVRLDGAAWTVEEWDGSVWLPRTPPAPPAAAPATWEASHHLVYAPTERAMLLLSPQSRVVWRYGPIFPANFTTFGAACAAPGRPAPRLLAMGSSLPWSGGAFTAEVQAIAAAQPVLVLLGSSRTSWLGVPLPLDLSPLGMPGCMLRVSANLFGTATVSGGVARWSLPIPGDPALLGGSFHLQALLADPTANAGGLLVTEGGTGTIGAR